MKIIYLGTAAYDAIPSPFCNCPICEKARKLGGKDLRTRSQALVNDDLLLDFNGDTVSHFLKYRIDDHKIKSCLITHSHSDHIYPEDIVITQYATNPDTVHFYAAEDGYNKIQHFIETCDNVELVTKCVPLTKVIPGEEFYTNGYRVLAVDADHDPASSPVIYAIERDGKRMLYAHDTGFFPEKSFERLKTFGKFDLISFDCTGAIRPAPYRRGHMNLIADLEVYDRLKSYHLLDEHTKIVVNHFSHNGRGTHEEIVKACEPYGFLVAYDGFEIEF